MTTSPVFTKSLYGRVFFVGILWLIGCFSPAGLLAQNIAPPISNTAQPHIVSPVISEILDQSVWSWAKLSAGEREMSLGIAYVKTGNYVKARQLLRRVAKIAPVLRDYLLYYVGEADWQSGHPQAAMKHWQILVQLYPQSRLTIYAQLGLIDAALQLKKWEIAKRWIDTVLSYATDPKAGAAGRSLLRRGEMSRIKLAIGLGDTSKAAALILAYYTSALYPDEALEARQLISQTSNQLRINPLTSLGKSDRLAIAKDFMERGLALEAARLLAPIANRSNKVKVAYARALFAARDYNSALSVLRKLNDQHYYPGGKVKFLQWYATSLARSGHDTEAIAMQERLAQMSTGKRRLRAISNKAFLLADAGRLSAAIREYKRLSTLVANDRRQQMNNAWHIAWSYYRLRQWENARTALQLASNYAVGHKLAKAQFAYWRGRIAQKMGNRKAARIQWKAVIGIAPYSYYGHLARRRLSGRSTKNMFIVSAENRLKLIQGMPEIIRTGSAASRELYRLGLWEMALEEELSLSELGDKFGALHHLGLAKLCDDRDLPVNLMLALIRQESNFHPQIVSRAGAIGLMQLMPHTAMRVAAELGERHFQVEELFQPVTNMRLGTKYFKDLLVRYHNSIPHALAGYNAGEAAVDRWIKRRRNVDAEEFVETIPFVETKNYVRRILTYYYSGKSNYIP